MTALPYATCKTHYQLNIPSEIYIQVAINFYHVYFSSKDFLGENNARFDALEMTSKSKMLQPQIIHNS